MIPNSSLTAKQQAFLRLWAAHPYRTQAEIARVIKVREATISDWKQDSPDFWQACETARQADFDAMDAEEKAKLRSALPEANNVTIANLKDANPYVRAHAAETVRDRVWGATKQPHELSGPNGGPIPHKHAVDLGGLTDDELDALERIAARLATPSAGASAA